MNLREGGSEECSAVIGGYMYEKCGFLFVDLKYVHCIYIRVYILWKESFRNTLHVFVSISLYLSLGGGTCNWIWSHMFMLVIQVHCNYIPLSLFLSITDSVIQSVCVCLFLHVYTSQPSHLIQFITWWWNAFRSYHPLCLYWVRNEWHLIQYKMNIGISLHVHSCTLWCNKE